MSLQSSAAEDLTLIELHQYSCYGNPFASRVEALMHLSSAVHQAGCVCLKLGGGCARGTTFRWSSGKEDMEGLEILLFISL